MGNRNPPEPLHRMKWKKHDTISAVAAQAITHIYDYGISHEFTPADMRAYLNRCRDHIADITAVKQEKKK